METEQNKKCSLCGGTGVVEMVLPMPFSNGDVSERTEEACPVCGGGV